MQAWSNLITDGLNSIKVKKQRLVKVAGDRRQFILADKSYLNFVSNDYLGLSQHPLIKSELVAAVNKYGVGSTGAATLSGYSKEQNQLGFNLAKWLGFDKSLIFTSGYQLNSGIFKHLVGIEKFVNNNSKNPENVIIWLDKNCHASHIDGILFSRCKFVTFDFNTVDSVISKIKQQADRLHIIVVEGVFSMDGACTYLTKLARLKQENHPNIMLVVDDAHGIAALGKKGFGAFEEQDIDMSCIDLLIGTLGKAFATHGAFICGAERLIDYLEQTVRSQIYTTCLPPAILAASNMSLNIVASEEGVGLRQILAANIDCFLGLSEEYNLPIYNRRLNHSPIQLLVLNNEDMVKQIYDQLLKANILVAKIFYPTVAKNAPRIRISLTSSQTQSDIEYLCLLLSKMKIHNDN